MAQRLQASVFAQQQQQHLAAHGWQSLFPHNPLLLHQHTIRDALAQLSSLSFPHATQPSFPHSVRATRVLPDASSRRDPDSEADSEEDSKDDFRPDLNEEDIRAPLKHGWRRYTIISRISASGVRGDVLYMSPEGKKLRNLNDIQRVSPVATSCGLM